MHRRSVLILIGIALLVGGVLVDRLLVPLAFRNGVVLVISTSDDKGCHGAAGGVYVRAGHVLQTDGEYAIACSQRWQVTREVTLMCECK